MAKLGWTVGAKCGPTRKYMDLEIFACEGCICIVDTRPGNKEGECVVLPPSELEKRIYAINQMYRNKTRDEYDKWQRQQWDRRVEGSRNCIECIKEARDMGDPSDPRVQAFWAKHRRNATISFAPKCDPAGYPYIVSPPVGKYTGRTAYPDATIKQPGVEQNRYIKKIRKLPTKKNKSGLIILE